MTLHLFWRKALHLVWRRRQSVGAIRRLHGSAILLNSPPKLEFLLKRKFFFSEANRTRSYFLAASFTGFLIRHYGWEKYKKLYGHAYDVGFKLSFKH